MISKIKNLISWLSIIWNDKDWSYIYLVKILRFKINKIEKYSAGRQDYDICKELMKIDMLLECIEDEESSDWLLNLKERAAYERYKRTRNPKPWLKIKDKMEAQKTKDIKNAFRLLGNIVSKI